MRFFGGKVLVKYSVGDILRLKKPHPCGGSEFLVLYTGSDVKIVCKTCSREMILERIKLDRAVKSVIQKDRTD